MKNAIFLILSILSMLSGFIEPAELKDSYKKSAAERTELKKEIPQLGKIEIEYGIKGYMRFSSLTGIKAEVKNIKNDFNGSIKLKYYSAGDDVSYYSKKIKAKKGENIESYFYVFLNTSMPDFTVEFLDEKGKEIKSFEYGRDDGVIDETSELVAASLLPKKEKISFFGEKDFRLKYIYLDEENIPGDYRSLSAIDLVIMPNEPEKQLKPETLRILKERERHGGVNIRHNETEGFSLKRLYMGKESRTEWTWKAERVLLPALGDLNIRTERYVAIIFIYIIVVSPVTYFILAKRKRKAEYWIFVPVWAVIFAAIIYMVSTDSRVDGIYMKYVSVLDLRKNKKNEDVVFSVTNSSKLPYKLEINNGYKVESLYGSYAKTGMGEADEKYGINIKPGGSDIDVKETDVFDTLFFKASGESGAAADNMGEICKEGFALKGEFKNDAGTALKKVFAVYDDEIIYVGDVEKGKSKKFAAHAGSVFLNDMNWRLSDSVFLNKIFGFEYEGESPKIKELMTLVLDKTSAGASKDPCFVALAEGRIKGEFASDIENINGYTILILPAEKKAGKNEDYFINSIGKLAMQAEDGGYGFASSVFVNKNSADISYASDKNKTIRYLSIRPEYKEEMNPCKVYILNHMTGRYDNIFFPDDDFAKKMKEYASSGYEGDFDRGKIQKFRLSPVYVEDGKINLRYEIDQPEFDEISAFSIPNIPKISMEYEE